MADSCMSESNRAASSSLLPLTLSWRCAHSALSSSLLSSLDSFPASPALSASSAAAELSAHDGAAVERSRVVWRRWSGRGVR